MLHKVESISIDFVNVKVPYGCHSLGCHTYLNFALCSRVIFCVTQQFLWHLSQAHQLMISEFLHSYIIISVCY